MTCFRLSPEVRAAVDVYCHENHLSITELYRGLTETILNGEMTGLNEGFRQGRQLGLQLAKAALQRAHDSLPQNMEDALIEYGSINAAGPMNSVTRTG